MRENSKNSNFKNAVVLTGGIGTGKSTVSSFLKMYGYRVIDADEISKTVFEEKKEEIKKIFGTSDRREIRKIVFNEREKLKALEDLILPEVKKRVINKAKELEKTSVTYFVDLPLYFEKQNYPEFKKVLVVYAPKKIQIKRVMERDRTNENEVISILKNQTDIETKRKKADFIIDNTKDLKHLQKEIESFLEKLKIWY